jgi:hypothetical protein
MTQIDARMRWMYGDRHDSDFIAGLHKFIDVAWTSKVDNFIDVLTRIESIGDPTD